MSLSERVELHSKEKDMTPLQIAIDGPVGSGKSHIASELAKELGITYLYTGAMYRACALIAQRHDIPFKNEEHIIPILEQTSIDLQPAKEESTAPCTVLVNGEDVTEKLFTPVLDKGSSDISTVPRVRELMVKRQQELAQGQSVVMEGRDIGLRVLPNASIKIFLTASLAERAARRQQQYEKKGISKTFEEILKETEERDVQDTTRKADPLQKLPESWEYDTTGKTPETVVTEITNELKHRQLLDN
jgi:cytidylate kinase